MKIFKSFKYALKGIIYTLKNERHMRIHVVVSLGILILSSFFDLSFERYILLLLAMALVMVAEIINSSIESVVDVVAKDYNSTAKAAKDMAAGGVLIAAGFSIIIGIILFKDIRGYINMINFLKLYPISLLGIILIFLLSYFYIFWGPTEIKNYVCKIFNLINRIIGKNQH